MPKPSSTPAYAFSQPHTAQSSSAITRQAEKEKFYSPLPPPPPPPSSATTTAHTQQRTASPFGQRSHPDLKVNTLAQYTNASSDNSNNSNNPFSDPQYDSRSPSPQFTSANPLLPGSTSSPAYQDPSLNTSRNMPASSAARNYGPRAMNGMPSRGESQSALLGDRDRVSEGSLSAMLVVHCGYVHILVKAVTLVCLFFRCSRS
jgi:hypothetical protein